MTMEQHHTQQTHIKDRQAILTKAALDPNPFLQFQRWFDAAIQAGLYEPNAMTLATADATGRPSARMVLLKGFDEQGFVFFTNYESRKGQELTQNPWAALVFWWGALEQQIRIEGPISKVTNAESDEYFQSRPEGSRLGAWISPQSRILDQDDILENRVYELSRQYEHQPIPRPTYWGGYRLSPTVIEFWQGRLNRLHDRFRYRRDDNGGWVIERLAP